MTNKEAKHRQTKNKKFRLFQLPNAPKIPGMKNTKGGRNFFFYFLLAFLLVGLLFTFVPVVEERKEKSFSEVLNLIETGQVEKIEIIGDVLKVDLKNKERIITRKDSNQGFFEILKDENIDTSGIEITFKDPTSGTRFFDLVINVLPVLLIILFFIFLFRQARGAGSEVFSFGKSRARLFTKDQPQIKFDNVGGAREAKQELKEIVDFLENPKKYLALGARTPKGVLLIGPSGTGKTLLARAVAGEANVPFFSIAGSEFMEMLVGVGASRVRDLFQMAKQQSPSIIFIDEIDAIGRQRGFGIGGGHDEREQTLNQILVEMDGFAPNIHVIVMSATNRPDMLDPALIRPGRFDRRVVLDLPDIEERKQIIKIHMQGKPFTKDVDIENISRRTVGFSGADIENMLNEAAILAAREDRKQISASDIEEAATKVKLGPEKRRMQSEEARKMTAYHEAGHGIVSASLPNSDPVHRISIVSRGLALGFTLISPQIDRYNETKTRLLEMIASLMGGRAAEELKFSEMTVGASSDIEKATEIARRMVTEYGMSALGPISFYNPIEGRWLARSLSESTLTSEGMAGKVDTEIKKILDSCYQRAKEVLQGNLKALDMVAEHLLKFESIEGDEFAKILAQAK